MKNSKNMLTGSPYHINPQQLSADRLLIQNSLRIDVPNFFKGDSFLHFFEVSNSTLHLLPLGRLQQEQPLKWEIVPLTMDHPIPSFHRSTATENGNIYLLGGTHVQSLKKSNTIYMYQTASRTLAAVA